MPQPFPTLETPRLILRPFTEDDAPAVFTLNSYPEVRRFTGNEHFADVEAAREMLRSRVLADYAKHGYGRWACVEKASGQVIGYVGLKYVEELQETDLGYRLLPSHWGRGLATEAAVASIAYGFEQLRLPRLLGLVDPENTRSVRVLEKTGFVFDRMLDYRSFHVACYLRSAPT